MVVFDYFYISLKCHNFSKVAGFLCFRGCYRILAAEKMILD